MPGRFLLRWVLAVTLSVGLANGIQYGVAAAQFEELALQRAAEELQREAVEMEYILAETPVAERAERVQRALTRITRSEEIPFAALVALDGRPVASAGGEVEELSPQVLGQIAASGRPVITKEDEGESDAEARYEFLLPVAAVNGAFVLEVDQRETVTLALLDRLRRGQLLGALVIVALAGPLSYLLGGRRLRRQAEQLQENAAQMQEQGMQLTRMAFRDPLTGLANRALLKDRLEHALAAPGGVVDVLLLDLDDFKTVNDVLGHQAGDKLLVEVAERLLNCVRPGDTVSRLGGDEFAIVLEHADDAQTTALEIIAALAVPTRVDRRQILPSASVGIARAECGEVSASELLRRADIAMYSAKAAGKNQCALFRPDMTTALIARANLELALRLAVERGEIVTHYQPIIDASSGQTCRVEALVRWQRPGVLVSPADFLPVAEQSGLIVGIGDEVLAQSCRQLRDWLVAGPDRSFAVNVSALQLRDPTFGRRVLDVLAAADVAPAQLVVEVTETLFLDADPNVIEQLEDLRDAGVLVAIDDFGTGYSSLGRLQALPVDELKIDKSFVDCLRTGHEAVPILTSMIAMAHNLGLKVTAEGVETAEQAIRLTSLGCEHLQGFYFSRPRAADVLSASCEDADLAAARSTPRADTKAARIVIVDDDRTIRILARLALADGGFDVYEAATGEHGRRLAVEVGAECVLVDLGLPDMDGIDLISALRSSSELDRTAIIVLTGLADRETKIRTFAAGADDYMVKPFMPQDLVARVQGMLRGGRSGGIQTPHAVPRSGTATGRGAATASTTR